MIPEIPVNLLKMDGYKGIAENYDAAVEILSNKHLIYGQPAIVPYYNNEKIYGLYAIGAHDSSSAFLMSDLINNFKFIDSSTKTVHNVGDVLDSLLIDSSAGMLKTYIDIQDASVLNEATNRIDAAYSDLFERISAHDESIDSSIVVMRRDVSVNDARITEVNSYHNLEEERIWGNFDEFYKKAFLYTKNEVDEKISQSRQLTFKIVDVLPVASVETLGYIYLKKEPDASAQVGNYYGEYVTITETVGTSTVYSWERIGDTRVDLSNYYTKQQVDSSLQLKADSSLLGGYTPKTRTIATLSLANDITSSALTNAILNNILDSSVTAGGTTLSIRNWIERIASVTEEA